VPDYLWGGVLLLLLVVVTSCQPTPSTLAPPDSPPPLAVLTSEQNNYLLREYTQVLPDTEEGRSLAQVQELAEQNAFRPYPAIADSIRSGRAYWGKVQVVNRLPAAEKYPEWVLTFTSTWTDLEVYTAGADGNWTGEANGSFTPIADKPFTPIADANLVKLTLPPNEVVTVYFRGSSQRPTIPPSFYLYLQPVDLFYGKVLQAKVAKALFIGFLVMMLLYNLIAYFFGRDRSFLFYSGYLLTIVIYAAYSSGDLADWLGTVLLPAHPEYLNLAKIVLFLGLMSYLAFIRSFLDLEQLLPRWDRYFRGVIYLGFPLLAVYLAVAFRSNFSYLVEDWFTMFYIALVVVSCFVFIYPLYRTRDTKSYFIVAGISVISLGCLLTLLSRLQNPPFSIFYLEVSAAIEVLIFSLGLAYRQRRQVQARQAADFALKESRLIQEKKQVEAKRLQELNDIKARFYTNITHEFRTPLTVILGMSEQIAGHPQETKLIQRNGANLMRLVNQLLDLSKLESGSMSLNLVHRDIIVFLQYLTESFYSTAMQQDIRLVFHSEEAAAPMDYDEDKIQQIVYNLLSNALKFTPAGGRVVFHAGRIEREERPWLKLKVKDTGTGIPAPALDRIFDRFYQVGDAESPPTTGTGIGLALTRELVELMNGAITVESEPGVGTEFVLYLPIEARHAAVSGTPDHSAPVPAVPLPAAVDTLPAFAEPEADPDPAAAELPRLLLIEDNADIITYVETILRGQYTFHTARDGAAGVERARALIPDVVVSDVMMPKMTGYEVCETLKQDERTSHIPIILLTAKATQEDKVQGLQFGADAYLTKPFDKAELTVRLEKLIAMRRRLQARYANPDVTEPRPAADSSLEDQFLRKLHEHIAARLNDTEFGVPDLAKAAQLSQMQLYRKLKALTGQTPSRFIRSYRLRRGLDLLQQGELTVSEVAYEVGFADPSYFSRTFQQEFKRNPSSFLDS